METQPTPQNVNRWDIFEVGKRTQVLISVLSVVVVIAGLWIASLLAPLVQDIAVIQRDLAAQEERVDDLKLDVNEVKTDVKDFRKEFNDWTRQSK